MRRWVDYLGRRENGNRSAREEEKKAKEDGRTAHDQRERRLVVKKVH